MFRIYRYQPTEENISSGEPSDEGNLELGDELGGDQSDELSDLDDSNLDGLEDDFEEEETDEQDSDFQGLIRTVTGACLVYKRKDEQNTYEELWVYNVGGRDIKPEVRIRNSILAGTDVDPKTQRSEDGQQTSETITVGNVQFLHIRGLLN